MSSGLPEAPFDPTPPAPTPPPGPAAAPEHSAPHPARPSVQPAPAEPAPAPAHDAGVQPSPEATADAPAAAPRAEGASSWRVAARTAWTAATSPAVALVLSVLLALLLALNWLLPQLPGQLDSEAGAADRWLATAAAATGALGGVLRSLGLFQIMQSTLLQLLLGALIFVLLLQLARLAAAAYTLRLAPHVLDHPGGVNGEPIPIAAADALLRWRSAHPAPPLTVAAEMQRLLDARLSRVERRTVRVAPSLAAEPAAENEGSDLLTLEERMLAVRGRTAALLRPLLALGMLAALLLIWINATYGWEYTADHLAPGDRMADAIHDLRFEYRVEESAPGVLQPLLVASVGEETALLPVQQEMQQQVGAAVVRAEPGAPGLIVQTVDGQLLLARPGQVTPVSSIGLGFPSAGSEETILLPQQAAGLRIVRVEQGDAGPLGDGFLVEVFQSGSEQAVLRQQITSSEIVAIPTPFGGIVLAMTPLPNLSIQVRHSPGLWLLWVALALSGLGLLGFWQQPGFVLAQIGPWPPERAVVTLQSDLPGEMESLKRWYSTSTQDGVKEL